MLLFLSPTLLTLLVKWWLAGWLNTEIIYTLLETKPMIRYLHFLLCHFIVYRLLQICQWSNLIWLTASKPKQPPKSKTINFDSSKWHRGHRNFEKQMYGMFFVCSCVCIVSDAQYSTFQFSQPLMTYWSESSHFYICTFILKIATVYFLRCIQNKKEANWCEILIA